MIFNFLKPFQFTKRPHLPFAIFIFLSAFSSPQSQSQENLTSLKQEITTFSNTLANTDESDNYAKSALKFAHQLQDATAKANPQQLAVLKSKLNDLNFGAYHNTLYNLLKKASTASAQKSEQAKQNWSTKIDVLRSKVKQACIDDSPSLELETLQIEAAGLERKRPQFLDSSTQWAMAEADKLNSASQLLTHWLDYHHIRNERSLKEAFECLSYLKEKPGSFPIIDKSDIKKTMLSILADMSWKELNRFPKTNPYKIDHPYENPLVDTFVKQRKAIEKKRKIIVETTFSETQEKIINRMESEKWTGKTILEYAEKLKSLKQPNKRPTAKQRKIYDTVNYLGNCLTHIERSDMRQARLQFFLSKIRRTSIPEMKGLERKAITTLLPMLFSEIKLPPLQNHQPLQRYLFELLSEPESVKDVSNRHYLLSICESPHWHNTTNSNDPDLPKWAESAERQYKWLSSGINAIDKKDPQKALYQFRLALYYAPDSGPATAQTLIESEIRKLSKSHPELFTPSSPIAERLAKAEEQVSELESILEKTQ